MALNTRMLLLAALLAAIGQPVSLQLVRYQPPRLMPADRDIVLEPGGTLRVRCEGNHPVTWNYSSLARDIAERVTITDGTKQDNPDFPYVSHIEIRDVTFLDVGYQSCHFVGTESMETRQNVTRVYLFVNDPTNLLVKTGGMEVLTVTQNQEAVLPCRPSHPEVEVALFKDGREVTDLAARSMIYKKREGYVIYSPVLTFHNGIFECKATLGDTKDKLQIFTHFNPSSDTVQQPWINADDAQHAYLGGNFTLECRVHHQAGIFHTLSWTVPGTSTGMKTGRIRQLDQQLERNTIPGGSDPDAASHDVRRLVVTDTRVEDEGYYTCNVHDQNGHENSRQEFVPIHDRTEASVQLQTDTTKFVTRTGDLVKIVVTIRASPTPEVIWYKPDGEEIVNQALKYSVVVRSTDTILQIFDLSLEDMGEYRVVATSPDGNATDSLVFDLTVQAAPSVSVGTEQLFFPFGEQVSLTCTATGWPAPVVGWEFAACATRHQCQGVEDFDDIRDIQTNEERESHITSPDRKWRVKSTLSLKAKQSGIYRCHATNKFPTSADRDAPFFVSDVVGGFGILPGPQRQVVVGDHINITCAGSRFAFDGLETITWLKESDAGFSEPVKDGDGIRVVDDNTMFSYQRTMVLTNIQTDKSGRYICSAINVMGGKNTTDRLVAVKASASPRFLPDSNMDKSASLTFEEGTRGELNCTVSGLPPPAIRWTKDGQPLEVTETGRIHVSPDGQYLVITAAISDDSGNYQCLAENRVGAVLGSASVDVPGGGANIGLIAGITSFMLLLLIALAACLVWKTRQQKNLQQRLTKTELEYFTNGRMTQFNPNMPIDEQAELLPYDSEWEFPKEKLILGRQIGSGAFGRVVKAEAIGLTPGEERTTVAVKMPKSGSDPNQIRSMMAELKIMIQLGKHLNVVNLLGAVTKHAVDGEFMVMVEYCRHGNLHQYLQRHKTCFIDQVDPITGEYDSNLGEEEYEAAMSGGAVNEHTPLNLAGGAAAGGGDWLRPGNRMTMASCDSLYKTPRCNSTASSIHSSAGFNTDMTTVDFSPAGVTGGEDSHGVPRLNTGTSVRPRRVPLTTRDLLRWSYQVARGMEYLASRKLLHGDLAARNILLAENNIVKISDFGLSRDIYKTRDYRKKGKGLLPVKWMAIESIQESIFSTQSDIWAFGVVMWEFFSLGASPYPGMEYDLNFVRRLRDGYRMERPKFAPMEAYKMMLLTWNELPGDRPSFTELAERIGHSLEEHIRQEYMLLNEPFKDLNAEYFARRTDYVAAISSPDYVNVTREDQHAGDGGQRASYVNMDPQQQTAAYRASRAEDSDSGSGSGGSGGGGGQTGPDGYLMMTPSVDGAPESGRIFSPRPTAVVKPFDHPPHGAANNFYNPSYDKPMKPGSRPNSRPTSQARPTSRPISRPTSRPISGTVAPPVEDEEHYLTPRLQEDEDHYLSPRLQEDEDHYLAPRDFKGDSAV